MHLKMSSFFFSPQCVAKMYFFCHLCVQVHTTKLHMVQWWIVEKNNEFEFVFVIQQQLQAYVAWVNSQIKKKAGSSMIHDLSYDMRDGVALAHLVEVVGKIQRVYWIDTFPLINSLWTRGKMPLDMFVTVGSGNGLLPDGT